MEDGDIKGEIAGWCIILIFIIWSFINWMRWGDFQM